MYVGFEQVAATSTGKTAADLNIPENCTGVEIQAETQNVRYTMDGQAGQPTEDSGMLFIANAEPKFFDGESLKNIRFRNSGTDGVLKFHYMGRHI